MSNATPPQRQLAFMIAPNLAFGTKRITCPLPVIAAKRPGDDRTQGFGRTLSLGHQKSPAETGRAFVDGCGGEERRAAAREQVQWTCESDERREPKRAADLNLGPSRSAPPNGLLSSPGGSSALGCASGFSLGRLPAGHSRKRPVRRTGLFANGCGDRI